jgi:hypothetical protein
VKKTASGIALTDVKSDSPLVTPDTTGSNTVTLNFDSSLGKLKDWNLKGHTARGWMAPPVAKVNVAGTSLVVESGGKGVRKASARVVLGSQTKLPATLSTILVKGLEQGNFTSFSTTGDAANNGANICITLTFD